MAIEIKEYDFNELARIYRMSNTTFAEWINPIREKLLKATRRKNAKRLRKFTPAMTKIVVEFLDTP